MSANLVQTQALTKSFGDFTALKSCDLEVSQGEVFGLLGPNGAGKSTLIRILMGFLRPTRGHAEIDGLDCYRERVAVHQRVSYLPGDARMYRLMRAKRVLEFFTQLRGNHSLDKACEVAERLELDLSRWVGFMSTGMRQKLALSVVMSADTPILFLDEPTANLDPSVRGEVVRMVAEAKQAGRTVIFSSHVLSEIEEVCDRVGILRTGELVHVQSIADLRKKHRIEANVHGRFPDVPPELAGELTIRRQGNRVLIETPGELSVVLKWLASLPMSDVYVQPIGLRAVYDQFHTPVPMAMEDAE